MQAGWYTLWLLAGSIRSHSSAWLHPLISLWGTLPIVCGVMGNFHQRALPAFTQGRHMAQAKPVRASLMELEPLADLRMRNLGS